MPLKVWLCEDATGINSKVEYDKNTDQLVGIVLPLNVATGMPLPFTFLARTAEDIQKHSKESLSSLVYVILALPLMPKVPPFVLQIFGIDNKFTAVNVVNRWRYTIQELKRLVNPVAIVS